MDLKEIGFAVESTYGGDSDIKNTITRIHEPITAPINKTLVMSARFDCPCCKKGITIKIDTKI